MTGIHCSYLHDIPKRSLVFPRITREFFYDYLGDDLFGSREVVAGIVEDIIQRNLRFHICVCPRPGDCVIVPPGNDVYIR